MKYLGVRKNLARIKFGRLASNSVELKLVDLNLADGLCVDMCDERRVMSSALDHGECHGR